MIPLPTGNVTFLFTDIEGSTRLLQAAGDGYRALLERHAEIIRAALRDHHGVEVSTEGDAFFAVFPSAAEAVLAVAAAQRALMAEEWPAGQAVKVRMGLHTGEGVLGGDNYIGLDVHRAARIAAVGHGGQVLVSGSTHELARGSLPGGLTLRDLGLHGLKDLSVPEQIFQLDIEGLPSEFPALRSKEASRTHLPIQLTSFVGRQTEIEQIAARLRDGRLVTLTGPGGTGKTRLAIEVASLVEGDFADGVYFVDLAPIGDSSLVAPAVAATVGLQSTPEDTDARLSRYLEGQSLLMVLDNFEQVLEAAPSVADWMRAAPALKVLATSRAALRVSGEVEYQVSPLQMPNPGDLPAVEVLGQMEAIRLFVERAQAARSEFRLDPGNAESVAGIVARLDGLPLAIELAAARVKVLPPKSIFERLSSTLDLLSAGSRDLPSRQQSLRAAIQWSYDLLEPGDRALLQRLGVFVRGAPLEAIEDVCSGGAVANVFDSLQSLVEQSLVRTMDEGDSHRFHLLETIRVFALEMLRDAGEEQIVRRDHFRHYSALAATASAHLLSSSSPMWLDRLEMENDNLRAALGFALQTGDADGSATLAGHLWRFWQRRGHVAEGRERVAEVLALPAGDPAARFAALEAAGGLAYWQADLTTAIDAYSRQVQLARDMSDDGLLIDALFNLRITQYIADLDGVRARGEVDELFGEAQELAEALGDPARQASVNWGIGTALAQAGRPGALEYLDRALTDYGATGNDFMVGWTRRMRSIALVTAGDVEQARGDLRIALDTFLAAGDLSAVTAIVQDYAALALTESDYQHAVRLVGAVSTLAMESETSIIDFTANRLPDLGHAFSEVGEEEAEKLLAEGRGWSLSELVENLGG